MVKLDISNNYIKYIALIFSGVLSLICMLNSTALTTLIFSFLILPLASMMIVRFDLFHPYVWYSLFFSLYALGYPILLVMNENNPIYYYGYSNELFYLHWAALFTFLLIVSPKISEKIDLKHPYEVRNVFIFNTFFYWILTILSILYFLYVQVSGSSTKVNLSDGVSVTSLGVKMLLIYVLVTTIELVKHLYKKQNHQFYKKSFITTLILLLIMFFTAERDLLFRFILIVFFVYYIFLYKQNHKFKLVIIGTLFFISIPISRSFKFFWMRGETESLNSNLLAEFINSEFHTQSRNVQLLINNSIYKSYFEYSSILNAPLKLINMDKFSMLEWFQNTFYQNKTTGMGFSLVGEGYLNGNYIGVICIFFIISLFVKISYINSSKNMYYLVIYLLMIPITIYTMRADLNNFLSQSIKQIFLTVILFIIIDRFYNPLRKREQLK